MTQSCVWQVLFSLFFFLFFESCHWNDGIHFEQGPIRVWTTWVYDWLIKSIHIIPATIFYRVDPMMNKKGFSLKKWNISSFNKQYITIFKFVNSIKLWPWEIIIKGRCQLANDSSFLSLSLSLSLFSLVLQGLFGISLCYVRKCVHQLKNLFTQGAVLYYIMPIRVVYSVWVMYQIDRLFCYYSTYIFIVLCINNQTLSYLFQSYSSYNKKDNTIFFFSMKIIHSPITREITLPIQNEKVWLDHLDPVFVI